MTEEKIKDLQEKMCQQMAADLSFSEALTVIQKSIEHCVKENIDKYSEQQKEEAYNYFFSESEDVDLEVLEDGKV